MYRDTSHVHSTFIYVDPVPSIGLLDDKNYISSVLGVIVIYAMFENCEKIRNPTNGNDLRIKRRPDSYPLASRFLWLSLTAQLFQGMRPHRLEH